MTHNPNVNQLGVPNEKIMSLTLDEYYERYVAPKLLSPDELQQQQHKDTQYKRTHYFGSSYLDQCKPKPGVVLKRCRAKMSPEESKLLQLNVKDENTQMTEPQQEQQ
ncbi:maker520 [Drosophila busckii]|uniref:Maker520 n=1 Tax=Drosophila busckii TaxID=30019 RepID=A0A0M4ERE2_DROBS|nr:uncharacterized protein LOC108605488 [Drosophila busckii]ALC39725.1 maker520 [Drosophila busckii]